MSDLSRRRFLQIGLGAGAAGFAARGLPSRGASRSLTAPAPGTTARAGPLGERALVVLEMAGGNDGLSMVVPYADPAYPKLRPDLAVDPESVLVIDEQLGLHPSLPRLHGRGPAIVAGVGTAAPDLSHFEMLRRWWTADPDGTLNPSTGFFGRICDVIGDPAAPVVGLSLGYGPSLALEAERVVTLSMDPHSDGAFPSPGDGGLLDEAWFAAQRAMAQPDRAEAETFLAPARRGTEVALTFADVVRELPRGRKGYPHTDLGAQLRMAARVLAADIGVRIVHVPYGADFDTHEEHGERYPKLMADLDDALDAFLVDIEHRDLAGSVLVASLSEFGRRVPENGSGLDHGAASAAFLLGPVEAGIHGEQPSLEDLDDDGNLVATVGMTDYYATIAEHWFGVPAGEVLAAPVVPLIGVIR
ncbi:MAG: DUF1501 domain-containing protein [Actinomycetota bacterium]